MMYSLELTPRERQVVKLVCTGLTNQEVAIDILTAASAQ